MGLGTSYERWAIYRLLQGWFGSAPPERALEGPLDGFAGMHGLHLLGLARLGTRVTVVLPDAAALAGVAEVYDRAGLADRLTTVHSDRIPPGPHDLVLSFNGLPSADDWRDYANDLAAASGRDLVVSVTHPQSYGVWIRRLLRRWDRGAGNQPPAELFDHESAQPVLTQEQLGRLGRIVTASYLDCPWWPDLFVPIGSTLLEGSWARFTSGKLPQAAPQSASDPEQATHTYTPRTFPYTDTPCPTALSTALRRHPVLEDRRALAPIFAHHRAYLVRVRS